MRHLDLPTLALTFLDRLVIGHFLDDSGNLCPKLLSDKLRRNLLILDRVVQKCRYDQMRVFAMRCFSDKACHLKKMINVRFLWCRQATAAKSDWVRLIGS